MPCRGWFSGLALAPLLVAGCQVASGAGAAAAAVAGGALSAECYDSVDVDVVRADNGAAICDASVVAWRRDGERIPFSPCHHAALTEGSWTIGVDRPGYHPTYAELRVPGGPCRPAVQSVLVTLHPVSASPRLAVQTMIPDPPSPARPIP